MLKKLIAALVFCALLSACADSSSLPSSASSTPVDAVPVPSAPPSAPPVDNFLTAQDASSSEAVSSEEVSETPVLTFYASFRDIPFVDIEYEYDSEYGVCKGELTKDGEPWCASPGLMEFGERCFTDGTRLWIQVFINPSNNNDFDWFHVCFDHFWCDGSIWTTCTEVLGDPPKTYWSNPLENKLFTYALGYTVYTDDGYSYTVDPCPLSAAVP